MSEEILTPANPEIIDLEQFQTNGQISPKAFWYKLVTSSESFCLTVLASSSTVARDGIKQQFPNAEVRFMGFSEKIMQVNG